MPVFTKKVIIETFKDFWLRMIRETKFGSDLKKSNMSVLFLIDDPNVAMFVDTEGPCFDEEAQAKVPEVVMKMNGDTVHKFWLKQILAPKALAAKQIEVNGSVGKFLQLLQMLEPGHKLYLEYCKKFNLST